MAAKIFAACLVMLLSGCAEMVDMILPDMSPPCDSRTIGQKWNGNICTRSYYGEYGWTRIGK